MEMGGGLQIRMGLTINEHKRSSWGDRNSLRLRYSDGCMTW